MVDFGNNWQAMIPFVKINDEVFYSDTMVTKVNGSDIAFLKSQAMKNERKRVRLCVHPGVYDTLHEMLIVHHRGNYVPPHKHIGKSESFHIVEGRLLVIIFNDNGSIQEVIKMGRIDDGEYFYYRLSKGRHHTIIPMSETVVFHETTNGPFERQAMVFAQWAPAESASYEDQLDYMMKLKKQIEKIG